MYGHKRLYLKKAKEEFGDELYETQRGSVDLVEVAEREIVAVDSDDVAGPVDPDKSTSSECVRALQSEAAEAAIATKGHLAPAGSLRAGSPRLCEIGIGETTLCRPGARERRPRTLGFLPWDGGGGDPGGWHMADLHLRSRTRRGLLGCRCFPEAEHWH